MFPHYEVRFFLPLLFKRPDLPCRSTLSAVQNNTAFSESSGHHTRVGAWADWEHLVLFSGSRRKPQPYTNSHRESGTAKSILRCGFSFSSQSRPELDVDFGDATRGRCSSVAKTESRVQQGKSKQLHHMCVHTRNVQSQYAVSSPVYYRSPLLTGFLNQAAWKGFHIWLRNQLYM